MSSFRIADLRPKLARILVGALPTFRQSPRVIADVERKLSGTGRVGSALVVAAACVFGVWGCSSEAENYPNYAGGPSQGGSVLIGPCEAGAEHSCSITLDQENGVLSCWHGTQYCVDGSWSDCLDGTLTRQPDPRAQLSGPTFDAQSLSGLPTSCGSDNPCDPNCWTWIELGNLTSGPPVTTLPSFPGMPAIQACAHDACTTGAALPATCDPCVAKVCAVDATCCGASGGTWDASCVDTAYAQCVGRLPPLGLCDFGLYASGILRTAGPLTGDVAIGANGNIDVGVGTQVRRIVSKGAVFVTNGSSPSNPFVAPDGIFALGNVDVQAGTSRVGPINSGGRVWLASGVNVMGSVWAQSNVEGQSTSRITQDAYYKGTYDPNVSINGTKYPGSTHAAPVIDLPVAIPTRTLSCTGTGYYYANGSDGDPTKRYVTLPPGNYDTVQIDNGGVLRLQGGGTYTFRTLYIMGSIQLMGTGPRWDVQVCNTLNIGNNGQIMDSTGAVLSTPESLTMYVHGGNVQFDTNVKWVGVLIAPNANFYQSPNGSINGAIWTKSLNTIEPGMNITGISKEACEALGIPGTVANPGMCPIPNTTPAVPAAIVEPCVTGRDCQINHRCVQPRTGGTCAHSKCLEGSSLASGCDECVQRICAADPSCCTTAWSASCVKKVATVCDATCGTPGGCVHAVCDAGSPLVASCGTCTNTVCALRPSCCSTGWDGTCVDLAYNVCGGGTIADPPNANGICDFAVFGKGAVAVNGLAAVGMRATVTGGKIGGDGSVNAGNADLYDDAYSAGTIAVLASFLQGAILQGSAAPPGTAGSTITGGIVYPYTPPTVVRPSRTFTCSATDGAPSSGVIAPGNYGAVTVPAGSTLTLQAGTYTFSSLTLSDQVASSLAMLALPASGKVTINVCNPGAGLASVTFGLGAGMTGLTTATALNVDLYAQGQVRANGHNTLYGFFNSESEVRLDNYATLYGKAVSNDKINVLVGSTVDSTNLREACINGGFDQSSGAATTTPNRLCAFSTYGVTDMVSDGNNVFRGGDVGARGAVTLGNTGARSEVRGSVLSRGNVTLNGSMVLGDVRTTGTIGGSPAATVVGVSGATPVPDPQFPPTPTFTCPTGGPNQSGTMTILPGTYGNQDVNTGQTLTFASAGKYYFNRLVFQQNNTIVLPATGVVEVYVCNDVRFGPNIVFSNVTAGAGSLRFRVYALSSSTDNANPAIYVDGGAANPVIGTLIAPNGKISFNTNGRLNGVAWGKQVRFGQGAQVSSAGTTGSACTDTGIDQKPTCPVTLPAATPPNESGDCQANETSYTDATCAGYDLALGVPCGAQIPVCNHGTAAFSGNVQVGYFSEADRQMSTPLPALAAMDGTCSGSLNIAAGQCQTLTCASALPSGTLTMMVDPNGSLAECDGRRLDNWSVHDGRTCTAVGPSTQTFDYLATCDVSGTSPRWGLLSWSGDMPGASTVTFTARVGKDAADAASKPFLPVAVADASRETCLPGDPACPIDLAKVLGLGPNQGPYMDVRIALGVSGSDAPTLASWRITYSCVYDE